MVARITGAVALRCEVGEQFRDHRQVADLVAPQAEAAPTNVEVIARAIAMANAAGKPGRHTEFVVKAREALVREAEAAEPAPMEALEDAEPIEAAVKVGALDYLPPHALAPDIAKRIYWASRADDYIGAWTGPVYVVTDDHSYSASELFASLVQFNHIAKTVGLRTGGDGCGFPVAPCISRSP